MRELKKASSVWVHSEIGVSTFAWQEGYAAFTVSPAGREGVRAYVAGEEEHHRTKSFTEELIEMLARSRVRRQSNGQKNDCPMIAIRS